VSGNPNSEPTCGGYYDSYVAEVDSLIGGTPTYNPPVTYSSTDRSDFISAALANYNNGHGIGAGAYDFLGGPADTPVPYSFSGWGALQAQDFTNFYNQAQAATGGLVQGALWGYVEIASGNPSYGWYTDGSSASQSANVQILNGFINTLEAAKTNVGIYSSPATWNTLFNENSAVVEWTYEGDSGPVSPCPVSFGGNSSAQFFGGVSSSSNQAIMWQWSQSGGDYDETSESHYNATFGLNRGYIKQCQVVSC
jgi:hypothetical protein